MDPETPAGWIEAGLRELEARTGQPFPLAELVETALRGAVFPLHAGQIVRVARENEAPRLLVTLLSALGRGDFRSLDAVAVALEEPGAEGALAP